MHLEKLLTKEEIRRIKHEAATEEAFRYSGMSIIDKPSYDYTKVLKVSDVNNLILIKGNKDTGYLHIRMRHNYWSTEIYPLEKSFQLPSTFPKDVQPRFFIGIADSIFSFGKLIEDNSHKGDDKFDLYVGNYFFEPEQKEEEVRLLLYKGTKIIHTLFVVSSRYNKKKKIKLKDFNFARGKVVIYKANPAIKFVFIPYLDLNMKLKHTLIVEKHLLHEKEFLKIHSYDDHENLINAVVIGYRDIIKFKGDTSERITYQHSDLRSIERIITEIDKNLNNLNCD